MRFKWRSKVKVTMIDPIRLPFRVNVLHSQREIEIEIGRSSGMKWNGMRDHGIGRKTSDKFEWFSGQNTYTLITTEAWMTGKCAPHTFFSRIFRNISGTFLLFIFHVSGGKMWNKHLYFNFMKFEIGGQIVSFSFILFGARKPPIQLIN